MALAQVAPATDSFATAAENVVPQDYYSHGIRAHFLIDAQRAPSVAVVTSEEPYADIGYDVNEEAFQRRSKVHFATWGVPKTVPVGWPMEVSDLLVWTKGDFNADDDDNDPYVYRLTDTDKAEIRAALEVFKGHGIDGSEVSCETFLLPNLSSRLRLVCTDVYEGRRFAIVRGLDPEEYPVQDLTIVCLGVSSYVCERWWNFGRNPGYFTRPLLFHHGSKIIASFSQRLLLGHKPFDSRTPGIPGLTEAQAEALDALHFTARKHEIKPRMMPGDLRFINNMAIVHRREAFENGTTNSRHLVLLWHHKELMCWKLPLPLPLRIAWARVFYNDEREEHWDIVTPMKGGKILRIAGGCY
ncbi:hypothetical protein B0J13DRAFT_605200 [Dactylonectria estremocensis]|uniref:TauD/TfdA-like domain-containing protein n=1 Tax=Dactylonectria estremocensis TaxID=1079267 RepID=A0A9P9JA71_9HYPO|nr:hypothetical protein B0J13DRAFT_605200 [Dactylonectria estremocensis]